MIKLIWQTNRETGWERDWLEYLFRKVPHETLTDYNQELMEDSSVIVYNSTVNNLDYVKKLSSLGKKFALVHLSDEWGVDSLEPYQHADIVFRTYYKDLGPNVINIPTGWMKDYLYQLPQKTVRERNLRWSFIGHMGGRETRAHMADVLLTIPYGFYYFIPDHENFPKTSMELSELYNDSIFVPCPKGNFSFDTLRVNEALQVGALPIVERSDYWSKLYGENNPLIQIDDWGQVPEIMQRLTQDLDALENLRFSTNVWWQNYREDLVNTIAKELKHRSFY